MTISKKLIYIKLDENLNKTLTNFDINFYTNSLWKELSSIDADIQEKEPFKLFKTDPEASKKIVEDMMIRFYTIIRFIEPILPKTVPAIIQHIYDREMPVIPLFPKVEMEVK